MTKLTSIISGWSSLATGSKKELAVKRAEVCADCDYSVKSKIVNVINDEVVELRGLVCDKCGCPLSAKVRSESEQCPLGKWKAHTN